MQMRAWNLLLAALPLSLNRGDPSHLRCLLQEEVDWETVFATADRHGVSSLLYQALAEADDLVPAHAQAALREGFQRNIHRTLYLARELIRILDCVESLGIEAFPYKGVVLSEIYYGDMAIRRSGDMDLLVRAEDVARIKSAVAALGYAARLPIPAEAESAYLASGYECTFDSPAGKNLLELQWALQPSYFAVDFDMRGVFARAEQVRVAGRAMKTPSPEDLLLILSLHAAKHVWGRLIWLCDIAQIARQESLNWDRIRSQTHALGIERILGITLGLTNRFLGAAIPSPMLLEPSEDRAAQALADQAAASIQAGVDYEDEKLSYFWRMMRLRERKRDQWRFAARLAFNPGPGEWEAIRLPKTLFPLYRIVRVARLAARLL
jgi:hypothetical protein